MAESGTPSVDRSSCSPDQPRYYEHAACRPYPTRWWFNDGPEDVEANLICLPCPVRAECLAFALDHPNVVGIWAATTTQERAWLRRARSIRLARGPDTSGRERRSDR